ncbi:Ppox [Drosophila busckii]|uniref:Protoporphyrinogen oxidase n=1 Tax=Drosophila busckii TaxID=30019 RepID=A0A0M4ENR0_DROBS|nr:protoporphyrinogen oxidase [Drosophila busckii]ALC46376.1 Ppox [Drosophila busckii]
MTTAVLGAGISGLSAAYYLLRRFGKPLTIYEASPRVGGWIRTECHKDKGFYFEGGAHTIRPQGVAGANTLELVEQLKLEVKPIAKTHVAARNRLLYAKGKLCMLPNSIGGLLGVKEPFTQPLYKALLHDLRAAVTKVKDADESIYSFVERRFGKELADYAISPMICGICAGDAREISVRFLMEELFEKEQKYGGVLKGVLYARFKAKTDAQLGMGIFAEQQPQLYAKACAEKWAMYGLEGGLEQLPRALRSYLAEQRINVQLSSRAQSLSFDSAGANISLRNAEQPAGHVISSLPAHQLALLVRAQHPSLAAQLLAIPYVDVIVINLQYNSDKLLQLDGFGLLVPPVEQLPILGIIFDSCCFDMSGNTVLTVMMGGRWFANWFAHQPSQKELRDIAQRYVAKILNISEEPKFSRVHTLQKCIPQYTVGHKRRVESIRNYIANYKLPLSVCGAAFDGVGINDVILSARRQVDLLPPQSA